MTWRRKKEEVKEAPWAPIILGTFSYFGRLRFPSIVVQKTCVRPMIRFS